MGRGGGVGKKQSRSRDEAYERENGHKGKLSPAVDFLADGNSVTTLSYDVIDFSFFSVSSPRGSICVPNFEFLASSFNRSRDTDGVPKFQNLVT